VTAAERVEELEALVRLLTDYVRMDFLESHAVGRVIDLREVDARKRGFVQELETRLGIIKKEN
jgi:hypothetical protein